MQHLLDSEAGFRLLFENSLDGILLTAPDGRIFDANPSAGSILGRTQEQVIAAQRGGFWILRILLWLVCLKNENVLAKPMVN